MGNWTGRHGGVHCLAWNKVDSLTSVGFNLSRTTLRMYVRGPQKVFSSILHTVYSIHMNTQYLLSR